MQLQRRGRLFAGLSGDGFVVVLDGRAVFGWRVLAGGLGEALRGAGGKVAPVACNHDDLAPKLALFDDRLEIPTLVGLLRVLRRRRVLLSHVLLALLGAGNLTLVPALGHGLLLALLRIGKALLSGLLVLLLLLLLLLSLLSLPLLARLLLSGAGGHGIESLVELVQGLS